MKQSPSWNSFTAPLSILESWDGISWFLNWYHFCGDRVERSSATFWNLLFFFFFFSLWMIIDQNIEMSVTVFFVLKCIAHQISEARRASVQRSHLAVVTNPLGQRQNLGTTCREHVTGLSMPPCSEMPYSERFSSSVALSSRSLPHLKTPDTSHPPCFPLPSRSFPDSHQPHFGFGSIWIVTQLQSDW